MPLDLPTLLEPAHTAILMMELQRGVIGDLAMIPDLADEVRATGVLARVRALCDAARANGARVVHCTAEFRADRAGSKANAPMLRGAAGTDPHLVTGTPSAEVVPEIGVVDTDLVVPRYHGMSPFTGTQLDQLLRNCGVTTVIAAGVAKPRAQGQATTSTEIASCRARGRGAIAAPCRAPAAMSADPMAAMPTAWCPPWAWADGADCSTWGQSVVPHCHQNRNVAPAISNTSPLKRPAMRSARPWRPACGRSK